MKMHSRKWWYSALRPLAAMAMLGLLASCGGVLKDDDTLCRGDREVCPCLLLLQSNKKVDFELEFGAAGKLSKVVFEQSKNRANDPSPELADAFVDCLVKVRRRVEVVNYARIDTAPLGQIANVWKRQTGFKVHLRPQDEREKQILNNLQIGPISGVKWNIMERWCSPNIMGNCVECSELNPDEDTVAVEVRLLEGAPVIREIWGEEWAVGGEREPWQLVDDSGVRYLYACRP